MRHLFIVSLFFLSISAAQNFGMVLLSNRLQGGLNHTWLIDNEFNFIHSWTHPVAVHSMVYLEPDSTLVVPLRILEPFIEYSHPIGGHFQRLDWSGNVLWEFTYYSTTYNPHHDIEPLPNGNILVICWEVKSQEEALAMGRANINGEIWPLKIVELEPPEGAVVWEWHLWDHLIQDVDPALGNYGAVAAHPELMDINCGGPVNNTNGDWIHTNAIDYNAELDQIIFSSRHMNEIYIIDHSTTSEEAVGHNGGLYGRGGDFLYRWGNPQNYHRGDETSRALGAPHGVNWILEGYPGSGNILIFNNQPFFNGSQEGNSEVIEIVLPIQEDGTYAMEADSTYGPWDLLWSFGGDTTFYSGSQSGAFRTPNGNTLITVSEEKRLFEVDAAGNMVWECDLQQDLSLPGWTARAQRIHPGYLNFPRGDLDLNYLVDIRDILLLCDYYPDAGGSGNYDYDINDDGLIDGQDLTDLICLIMNNC
jgi:hypothetical protein